MRGAQLSVQGNPPPTDCLLAADRQTLASFGPAAFQHETSVLRAHSHQKSVRLSAPSRVRLKRALSLAHGIPRRTNTKTRLANDLVCSTDRRADRPAAGADAHGCSTAAALELSMVAKRFQGCQSAWLCVTVAVLQQFLCPQSFACVFGLFPKFSTPVEKTVENRQI